MPKCLDCPKIMKRAKRCPRCQVRHRYNTDPEYAAKVRGRVGRWARENKDLINERKRADYHTRPGAKEKNARWRKRNPERWREIVRRGNSKKYKAVAAAYDITPQQAEARIKKLSQTLIMQRGRCEECGKTEGLEAHHINPILGHPVLALETWNIAVLCKRCHINADRKRKGQEPLPEERGPT